MVKKIGRGLLLLGFSLVAVSSANAGLQKKSEETLEALIKEFSTLQKDFQKKARAHTNKYRKLHDAAKTQAEKTKIIAEHNKKMPKNPSVTIAPKIIKIAEADMKSEIGLKAMTWVLTNQPRNKAASKYVKAIEEHHAMSEYIGDALPAFQRLRGQNPEPLFRKVLDKNKHPKAQGLACYSLASYLAGKTPRGGKTNPEVVELYERIASDFAKIEYNGKTLAKLIEGPFFELKYLQIGKVVPDIVAEDIDGKEFKLSDYRGKVVVIDFWGNW